MRRFVLVNENQPIDPVEPIELGRNEGVQFGNGGCAVMSAKNAGTIYSDLSDVQKNWNQYMVVWLDDEEGAPLVDAYTVQHARHEPYTLTRDEYAARYLRPHAPPVESCPVDVAPAVPQAGAGPLIPKAAPDII